MKKLLIFAPTLLFLLSCSNDSSNTTSNSSIALHPPIWTHGTWTYETGGQQMGLKFSPDNVCNVTNSNANCYKEALALYENTQATTSVTEEISETEYKVVINISGGIVTFDVAKVSTDKINWKINSNSSVILNRQ